MKIKEITIRVKSLEESLEEYATVLDDAMKGKYGAPKSYLTFSSLSELKNFFTPRRIEMLKAIRRKSPRSVYGLAKILKRDIKSVTTDLKILEGHGLVELKKSRERVTPSVGFDKLRIDIEL